MFVDVKIVRQQGNVQSYIFIADGVTVNIIINTSKNLNGQKVEGIRLRGRQRNSHTHPQQTLLKTIPHSPGSLYG